MRLFICDCCGQPIKSGRETSDLKAFKDLCGDCYEGFHTLKVLIRSKGKDVLKQLKIIAQGGVPQ